MYNRFFIFFAVLFTLLVVVPCAVDLVLNRLFEGMVPRYNSIIVFKEFVKKQELVSRFLIEIRKIISLM